MLVIILLLTFFIVRAFKSKYQLETDCFSSNWIDTVITTLTLTSILISSFLLISSLKYISENNIDSPSCQQPVITVDKTEDFIRRNSQQNPPQLPTTIEQNSSFSSGSWLSAVRTEAYETHRRISMAPVPLSKDRDRECNRSRTPLLKPVTVGSIV